MFLASLQVLNVSIFLDTLLEHYLNPCTDVSICVLFSKFGIFSRSRKVLKRIGIFHGLKTIWLNFSYRSLFFLFFLTSPIRRYDNYDDELLSQKDNRSAIQER